MEEEENDNSITQKLAIVRKYMENTENPKAREPEGVTPKIEGSELLPEAKTEPLTPKVNDTEVTQEYKPVVRSEPLAPKVGDNNNQVAPKPETVPAKVEAIEASPARKLEAAPPKTPGGEPPVVRNPVAQPVIPRRINSYGQGEPPAAPKNGVKPVSVTPVVEVQNNSVMAARKPETVIPVVEVHNNGVPAARKPETIIPVVEVHNNGVPAARKPEAIMARAVSSNDAQARRPEARVERGAVIPETPVPSSPGAPVRVRYERVPPAYKRFISEHEAAKVRLIEEQCRSFCLSLFSRGSDSVRSLGITSCVPGEGKSFITTMIAQVLSRDSLRPVLLIECDWEDAKYRDYFGIPPVPGLAEWLRGECTEADIRYRVNETLSVIRAGDGQQDAVRLIQYLMKLGLQNTLARNDENLLIDLPPVITSSYSVFAASMVEALALVVRAGVTPHNVVADACNYLGDLPVQGIILNQVDYHSGPYSAARKTP
jgi:Mrp family chromosome partitioning ATPase